MAAAKNSKPRTLRAKHLRARLWYAADGKCQQCGAALDPKNWHADHIEAWIRTGRTNIHEMQALCPSCNLKKGAR
jgi:5-methylcytosine-specific restriction endonuclease McrA